MSVPTCDIETPNMSHECNALGAYVIFIPVTMNIAQTYEMLFSIEMYWYKR